MSERDCARRPSTDAEGQGVSFPADFSMDEEDFASELRELFPIEQEILPPLFAQTLADDDWQSLSTRGLEHRMAYSVFRKLSLPRRPLFASERRSFGSIFSRSAFQRVSRPFAGTIAAAFIVMLLSVVVASPSFAAGLNLILGHTGVVEVRHYPQGAVEMPQRLGPRAIGQAKPQIPTDMPIAWLGQNADKYVYLGTRALNQTIWSNGPIVDMQYVIPGQTNGSGVLDIRQFRLDKNYAAVLQVVQQGAANLVQVGQTHAVYVNGVWRHFPAHVSRDLDSMSSLPYWQSDVRSELIMEWNGSIIWISADQRDGATMDEMIKIGRSLQSASNSDLRLRISSESSISGRALDALFTPPEGPDSFEVYELVEVGKTVGDGVNAFVISGDAQ